MIKKVDLIRRGIKHRVHSKSWETGRANCIDFMKTISNLKLDTLTKFIINIFAPIKQDETAILQKLTAYSLQLITDVATGKYSLLQPVHIYVVPDHLLLPRNRTR